MTAPATQVLIDPNIDSPVVDSLTTLIANMVTNHATDVHLRKLTARARIRDRLVLMENWKRITDSRGSYLNTFDYEKVRDLLLDGQPEGTTVVYRLRETYQVRVQLLRDDRGEKLLLRLQFRTPPKVETIFEAMPKTLELVANARGLILVSGPVGAGKSTLAAGLALHLAELGRHIITLEDPVEYYLDPQHGEVSQFSCRTTPEKPDDNQQIKENFQLAAALMAAGQYSRDGGGAPDLCKLLEKIINPGPKDKRSASIMDHIPLALRGDMDGLYIGETRTHDAIRTCLAFAGAEEPVLTTFHAGGIADAVCRLVINAGEVVGPETARLMVAQSLKVVFNVKLAYNPAGKPVPVVTCLPISSFQLRQILAVSSPVLLANQLENSLKDIQRETGAINRQLAYANAKRLGATEESLQLALPPDPMKQ